MAIEINNLEKKFANKIAVNKINLSINEGELFSLLGVNGAGKTTTIRMLSCLSKPTSGDALLFNKSIVKDKSDVKKMINLSPQETAVAPNLSVRENLELICQLYEVNDYNTKVDNIIKKFKLEEVSDKKSKLLSGGYQRRLSIAMAIITEPRILFLDEPTLGLDVLARRELWKVIEKLKETTTIVLTTHYMEEAEILSDRIAIMNGGDIIEIGSPKEIIKKQKAKTFEDAFVKIVEGESK